MNKALRTPVALFLVLATAFALTACGKPVKNTISVYDGMNLEQGYDTSMLYRNTTDFQSGDYGVIYVSEEEAAKLNVPNAESYGGYFYQYNTSGGHRPVLSTADGKVPNAENGPLAYTSYVQVTRSKDLVDWEPCGAVDNGMGLRVDKDDWLGGSLWAPECIYDPVSNKYYMYFSAASQINNGVPVNGIEKIYSSSSATFDRFYIGIAVSDTPVGPFVLASSENVYGDATQVNPDGEIITSINPPILLDKKCDEYFYNDDFKQQEDFSAKDEIFSVIDTHPVVLEDGLYLYFVKHISTGSLEGNTIWAMKMKDMITPDYSTISMIIGNSAHWVDGTFFVGTEGRDVVRVEYKGVAANDPNYEANKDNPNYCINDPVYPRHLATSWIRYTTYADGTQKENAPNGCDLGVVEGQQVITTKDKDGKTVYILTYACRGVDNYLYDLRMAYSYNPLHGFVKPTEEQGATILGVDAEVNDFMSNLAHVQFLEVDGELWICHAERMAPFSGADMGRFYALASVSWQYLSDDLPFPVPVANGPTTSLQPLPSVFTGYRNIAPQAKVNATNVVGDSLKYLTDGMMVTNGVHKDKEFVAKENSTTITVEFDGAKTVRGILLYNSYTYDKSFAKVSEIEFTLANGSKVTSCSILDLPYNVDAYRVNDSQLQPGSAAIALFNDLEVVKVIVHFESDDKLGAGEELAISELMILGR